MAKRAKVPAESTLPGFDFEAFLNRLSSRTDSSRLSKALSMLKAKRFQLYAQVTDDALVGVVKSQTDRDLVYSCRLNQDGSFACCTQNLRPCGGLRGALCKHLLVLIVGLTPPGNSTRQGGGLRFGRAAPRNRHLTRAR